MTFNIFLTSILVAFIAALVAFRVHRKSIIAIPIKEFADVFSELIYNLQLNRPFKMKDFAAMHNKAAFDLRTSLDWLERRNFKRYWKQYQKKAGNYDASLAQTEMLDAIEKLIKQVKGL